MQKLISLIGDQYLIKLSAVTALFFFRYLKNKSNNSNLKYRKQLFNWRTYL